MDDLISREAVADAINGIECTRHTTWYEFYQKVMTAVEKLPPAQPEIIRCKDCKLNPKYEWFGCPMSHLSEKQRPETAWCWKAERRTDERFNQQTGGD